LENLIGNAWKFTRNNMGAKIEFGETKMGDETAFFVRDNGAGFDPSGKEKLFSPFQRLHSEAEFEGTGIGLATVKRVMTKHGGRIWGEGEVGKGAVFYFVIQPFFTA
jgi:light-regulated signal transduction histidine kinase (bacteriophytochrome)